MKTRNPTRPRRDRPAPKPISCAAQRHGPIASEARRAIPVQAWLICAALQPLRQIEDGEFLAPAEHFIQSVNGRARVNTRRCRGTVCRGLVFLMDFLGLISASGGNTGEMDAALLRLLLYRSIRTARRCFAHFAKARAARGAFPNRARVAQGDRAFFSPLPAHFPLFVSPKFPSKCGGFVVLKIPSDPGAHHVALLWQGSRWVVRRWPQH
ncbi:hypothetical protein GN956_G1739 [Arapaima gigas]